MATIAPLTSYAYTAGTCVLRLTGQVSALSGLADRPVLKRSRFQLQLWEAPDWAEATQPTANLPDPDRPPIFDLSGREPDLADLTDLVQRYVQTYLQGQAITPPQGLSQGTVTLAPVGLTRHRLAVTRDGNAQPVAVNLSTLQLADLAEVLSQADQAVEHLPVALGASAKGRSRPRLPLWMGSVAAVLVAAVLGSQWLTNTPVTTVQSPVPTAETAPGGTPETEALSPETAPSPDNGGDALAGEAASDRLGAAPTPASPAANLDDNAGAEPTLSAGDQSAGTGMGAPASPRPTSPAAAGTSRSGLPPVPGASQRPSTPPSGTPSPQPRSVPTVPADAATAASPPAPASSSPVPPTTAPPVAPSPEPAAGQGPTTSATESQPPAQADQFSGNQAPGNQPPSHRVGITAAEADATEPLTPDWLNTLRTALQAQWTASPSLGSPLRYTLTVGPRGEVLGIEPLTTPSRQYLEGEPLLQVGDVIPNLQRSQPATVEVQLLPSGEVLIRPMAPAAP